jgi:hypothetical protein
MNVADAMSREIDAARVLIEQIRALAGDDETLLFDTLEGETSIFELIAKLDAAEVEDQAAITGLDMMLDRLEARKRRIKAAIETKRSLIANALDMIGKKTHKTALGTITISASPITAVVTDESAIPSRFWRQPAPVLDKKALNDAVKAGEAISGAEKSNGGVRLQIRRG